jgi:nucleoside-diphosphate-sugar epimerase
LRILVTGHLGYLGTRLVPILRTAGMEVVGLDNGLFRDCAIAQIEPAPAIEKDIRDVEAADVSGFDAIIHLAGFSSEELGHVHPALTFEVNFEATMRLAQLAREAGVRRFLFASSTSVYGPGATGCGEGAPLKPESPYAVSKALAEEELARLARADFSPAFLRAAQPYGVSPMLRFEPILNNLVSQAAADSCIRMDLHPQARFDLIHVEDLARAYLAVLQAPDRTVHRQAFNIGVPGETYSLGQLAAFVRETAGGAQIEALGRLQTMGDATAKFGKIGCMLPDYRPRWTARRGAVEVLDAVGRLGLGRADIEGARYDRVRHLKMLVRLGRLDDELRLAAPARMSAASLAS